MEKLNRIAIHSVPRSGSTWLGSIFDSHPNVIYKLQPLFSYKFKDRLSPKSSKMEIDTFFEELRWAKDEFLDQKEGKNKNIIPEFGKEKLSTVVYKEVRYHNILFNLLKKDQDIKVIGLIRNPFSVVLSWLNAPKEFKKELGWEIRKEWRYAPSKNLNRPEEYNGYEKWKEAANVFLKLQSEYPENFCIVTYEELLTNSEIVVKNLFTFCGLTFPDQTEQFLKASSSKNDSDAYSVFKKKKVDQEWKKKLPSYIIEDILVDRGFLELNKRFQWV